MIELPSQNQAESMVMSGLLQSRPVRRMSDNVSFALLLALLAGLSTGVGNIIAYFIRKSKGWQLSLILGFSAGVVVCISFAELLQAALDTVGFVTADLGFFIGIAFIAIVDILVPHEYKQERVGNSRF
jgi:ZIP family zinc transporter